MALSVYSNKDAPVWQIVEHLQRQGASTVKELELVLGITTTAVRQHLNTLQADGYVERRRVNTGVGRPHHAYFITARARDLFTCHCDDLALTLLEEVFTLEGIEKTKMLLERVSDKLAQRYRKSIHSTALRERVYDLATALNERGVLADVETADNDVILLQTYNCPYHDLAQEHNEICEMDKAMVRKVLGSNVDLNSRIVEGGRCCSFAVAETASIGSEIT